MERVKTTTTKVESKTHYFYCDHCGTELGHSTEYLDGYYHTFGEFKLHWLTPKGWYTLNKCLCDSCKEKYLAAVHQALVSAGFDPDNH